MLRTVEMSALRSVRLALGRSRSLSSLSATRTQQPRRAFAPLAVTTLSQRDSKDVRSVYVLTVAAIAMSTAYAATLRKDQAVQCDDVEPLRPTKSIDHNILKDIDEIFRSEKEAAHIPGMSYGVFNNGKLIHSVGLGFADVERGRRVDRETRFRIASMSKSFTAMAVLKLRDEGKLSLEDPISNYIPELKLLPATKQTSDHPVLTIRHLLTHAGGLPQEDPWGDRLLDMPTSEFKELIADGVQMSNVPGHTFEYSNLGYALLGQIIEGVSGVSYQQYITDNIFKPLGMLDTTYEIDAVPVGKLAIGYRFEDSTWSREDLLHDGAFGAMGGIITTLEDFSKYVSYHMSAWPAGGETGSGPLCRSSLREMHTAAIVDVVTIEPLEKLESESAVPPAAPTAFVNCYGLGFRVAKFNDGTIIVGHAGGLPGYGCDFRFLPTHTGLAILSLTNRTYASMSKLNMVAIKRILKDVKQDDVEISEILTQRTIQLKSILVESCVVPPRKDRLSYNYDAIWKNKARNCFSSNFFKDISVANRSKQFQRILMELGGYISDFSPIIPTNQLRGKFVVSGVNGRQAEVSLTMTPESIPKIQHLTFNLLPPVAELPK